MLVRIEILINLLKYKIGNRRGVNSYYPWEAKGPGVRMLTSSVAKESLSDGE